ncbi:MAG TPA: histidine phosphatase family protein [Candidatus Paceibacterota bacterium]|nr:histidine phosphatase family protein [Candidatus Paceibacterota bacterium]
MQSLPETIFLVPALVFVALLIALRMRIRRFYFIRHGETLLNAQHIRQGAEGSLSLKGQEQADQVGKFLKDIPIKRIISSPYTRAKETATIINAYFHVPITYSPLLTERRNPSEIIGKSTQDPDVVRIVDQMDLSYHPDEYRFSDEENFIDMKTRAKKFVDLAARQGTGDTIVVTHHLILKMIIAYTLYRQRLHAKDFIKLTFFNTSDNAGITICEYHPWKMFSATRGWEIISYNKQPD